MTNKYQVCCSHLRDWSAGHFQAEKVGLDRTYVVHSARRRNSNDNVLMVVRGEGGSIAMALTGCLVLGEWASLNAIVWVLFCGMFSAIAGFLL